MFRRCSPPCAELNVPWQIEYLKQVYPLYRHCLCETGPILFSQLNFYFTNLLPERWKRAQLVYTARVPGPSCEQLPCKCDPKNTNVYEVQFDPDPLFDRQWPVCSAPDSKMHCCRSVEAFKDCMRKGELKFESFDTWDGLTINALQPPPSFGMLWKPSLMYPFTAVRSEYPGWDWNAFWGQDGFPDESWVEVTHSAFSAMNPPDGVWFYQVRGSGIFLYLGKTLCARNKLDAIRKLGLTYEEVFERIRAKTDTFYYWLAGQKPAKIDLNKIQKYEFSELLKIADHGSIYNINRMLNSGLFDIMLQDMAHQKGYLTVQMTVQPNLYNGWASELVYLGMDKNKKPPKRLWEIPPEHLRLMGPCGSSEICEFPRGNDAYPSSCLYCLNYPNSLNLFQDCTQNVQKTIFDAGCSGDSKGGGGGDHPKPYPGRKKE